MPQLLQRRHTSYVEDSVLCPLCGQLVDIAPYQYSKDSQKSLIYLCKSCCFLFGRPVFISEQNQRQMDSIDDAELYNSAALRFLHRELNLKREIRAVRSILGPGTHRVLDIGCGTGWTSAFWQKNGFHVTGLEPSSTRRAVAQERYGLTVIGSYLEDTNNDQKYDLVILRHIIEHFESPKDLLAKAADMVADDGLLLIILPNINCLGRYIFDTYWTWVLPWHCNFFSPIALETLTRNIGFKQIRSYQTPSPLYYQESFLRRFPSSFFKKIFSMISPAGMLVFSPLIAIGWLIGLGDNLCVIAKKSKNTNH